MKYYRPSTLIEAVTLLQQPGSAALAGGTHLLAERPAGLAAVVDLSALGLEYVRREGDFLAAGAMTHLQTLAAATDIGGSAGDVLREAARLALPRPLRDMATLGGTVAWGDGELVTALLALGAEVKLQAEAESWISLDDFLAERETYLAPGCLIVAVRWPVSAASGCALARVARTPADHAILTAVARVERSGESVASARLALGGLTRTPFLIATASRDWTPGAIVEAVRAAAQNAPVVSDVRAAAAYRREVAPVVARRALAGAWERAGGAA